MLHQPRTWKMVTEFSSPALRELLVLLTCNLSAHCQKEGQDMAGAPVISLNTQSFLLHSYHCFYFLLSLPHLPSFLLPTIIYFYLFGTSDSGFFSVRLLCHRPWKALELYHTYIKELFVNHSLFMFTACLISWFLGPWIFCVTIRWPFIDLHTRISGVWL